ncbi:mitochondrial basic amino acids transporter [Tetranychus urticae]|uniref:mitochondrial basic amino acids transporter n=1 Tax=Tetranychus urticae TaxID=32264 RepID=UPI00077B881B|nr:mitochondrial basic amino acids transporter [Tetranychus urticae]
MSLIDFVAGCWGGACGVLVGHPLDTIKVRLQTCSENVKLSTLLFNKNQKLGGLFSGLSSPLACLAFVNAIVFGVYGNLNEYLKRLETTSNPFGLSKIGREFVAGTVAGVAQCIVTCPMELVKCRMQTVSSIGATVSLVNQGKYSKYVDNNYAQFNEVQSSLKNGHEKPKMYNSHQSQHQQHRQLHSSHHKQASLKHNPYHQLYHYHYYHLQATQRPTFCSHYSTGFTPITVQETLRTIKATEKSFLRGLYRGMIPTLLRDAPAFGIYFSSFQYLIDRNPEETSETKLLLAGGIAGALSWLFIYPFDVIKTKIQTEGVKYDYSMVKCSKAMYRESSLGWKVFFRGFTPTLIRAFPVNAVTFYVVNKTFVLYENYL